MGNPPDQEHTAAGSDGPCGESRQRSQTQSKEGQDWTQASGVTQPDERSMSIS
jgi:hypothetical protein